MLAVCRIRELISSNVLLAGSHHSKRGRPFETLCLMKYRTKVLFKRMPSIFLRFAFFHDGPSLETLHPVSLILSTSYKLNMKLWSCNVAFIIELTKCAIKELGMSKT